MGQSIHSRVIPLTLILLLHLVRTISAATLYVDLTSANPTPPYSTWLTAAINIQVAINAASAGDTVLVTNGIYAFGGKVMAGDLTNRIALDKALAVQSVNGPAVTIVQGAGVNGSTGVRCAWLTNGAVLNGFTLQRGATRSSGDMATLGSGGGVWCASSNATVVNCVIKSNTASVFAGGAYQGTLNNCSLSGNTAQGGGGSYSSVLNNCVVSTNSANFGGGANGGTLKNCAVTANSAVDGGGLEVATAINCTVVGNSATTGGGMDSGTATNCIVYSNTASSGQTNYASTLLSYSCSTPLPPGIGNITNDPQLLPDGVHLASTSPCRGRGTNSVVVGADIDGQPWANPPSIGCDEWQPEPVVALQPKIRLMNYPIGFTISVVVAGSEPFICWWSRNGVPIENDAQYNLAHTTNLSCSSVSPLVGGSYQVVISNGFGMTTSGVAQVSVHCVDAAGVSPVPPYSSWATASTNIQDAITTASAGEIVLVTNGIYGTGGKSMDGAITNRVVLDKAIALQSVNGPDATFIQGSWNPIVPIGSSAIRCAWLTNGSIISGFTLRGGATRSVTGSSDQYRAGGGIWGASTNATAINCVLATNSASYQGGGAYQITLNNCVLTGNHAVGSGIAGGGVAHAGSGGGAASCNLNNCVVTGNFAQQEDGGGTMNCNLKNCAITRNSTPFSGSGAIGGILINCTISGNTSAGYGFAAAAANAALTNCIIYGNFIVGPFSSPSPTNYYNCILAYCDSDPASTGIGNIDIDPQLLADGIHLVNSSPCRSAGAPVAAGTDIDGQPWANPPAIGCDEWQPFPLVVLQPQLRVGLGNRSLGLFGVCAGAEPFTWFWSKDGNLVQDDGHHVGSATSNLVVKSFDSPDAGVYQFVVSNAFGMVTSIVTQVTIHCVGATAGNPSPPYLTWPTAATNIQDAIDAAASGEIVLVTNGVYSSGGRAMYPDLTNRVVLDKALTVIGMNGYPATVIQGAWDAATNGPASVRCAWLAGGATLAGFTLQGGATRTFGGSSPSYLCSGGAVWCATNSAVLANCLIRSNAASFYGGGIYQGTINNCAINNNFLIIGGGVGGGGGAYGAYLTNCTVTHNTVKGTSGSAGGVFAVFAKNSIIFGNNASMSAYANYDNSQMSYCDIFPAGGVGNLSSDPQLLNDLYLSTTSPCRGAGSVLYASGLDLDGEAWNNPPSIGCDEPWESDLVGPLSIYFPVSNTNLYVNHSFTVTGQITGRAARVGWDFGDGTVATNVGTATSHTWTNAGVLNVILTAYNADNVGGVSGNLGLNVLPVLQPQLASAAMATNGFQFQFPVQSNLVYTVQKATNLTPPIVWLSLQSTSSIADGVIRITDASLTNSARFYRLLVQ